jgi:hypothetical protein
MAAHAHLSINFDNTHDCEDQCACSNPDAYLADNDCHCNQGYSGNGLTCLVLFFFYFHFFLTPNPNPNLLMTCLAINYCTEDTHGCSDVCNVTGPGTFDCLFTDPLATLSGKTCICPNGYSGNGRNCSGNHIFPTFEFSFIFPSLKKFLMDGKILFLTGNLQWSSMQIILNVKYFVHKKIHQIKPF